LLVREPTLMLDLLLVDWRRATTLSVLLVLFACGSRRAEDAAETIVVPGDVNHEAFHALQRARGRHLTREEMLQLHRVWIDNEVLYREGLKLPSRPGDSATRERVMARALSAIDEKVRPTSVSDEELRRWFDSRRDTYEQPSRLDFEYAAFSGPSNEAAVRALVEQLDSGAPLDAGASLRTFKGRPEASVVQSYGPEVAGALVRAAPGKWQALQTREGWRAMRLTALTPGRHATFDAAREAIRRDFIEAAVAEKRDAAVRALWRSYKIELEETIECLADKG
jgi:PPIC-type PPIASE domain